MRRDLGFGFHPGTVPHLELRLQLRLQLLGPLAFFARTVTLVGEAVQLPAQPRHLATGCNAGASPRPGPCMHRHEQAMQQHVRAVRYTVHVMPGRCAARCTQQRRHWGACWHAMRA